MSKNKRTIFSDIQANILKSHGRNYANFIFLKFRTDKVAELKKWISEFARSELTDAQQQIADKKTFHEEKRIKENSKDAIIGNTFVRSFMLSANGYRILGQEDNMPQDTAFKEGMKNRSAILGDTKLYWEGSDVGTRYSDNFSALIIAANDYEERLDEYTYQLIWQVSNLVEICPMVEKGRYLKKQFEKGRRPVSVDVFGFADGLNQPDISCEEQQLDIVLHEENQKGRYGSYVVFRKFQQDKQAFEGIVRSIVKKLNPQVDAERQKAFIEAQFFGRFKDGTPLLEGGDPAYREDNWKDYKFDFPGDSSGIKCPFHSHVRKMNPQGDPKSIGIIRRGIPYNHGPFDRERRRGGEGLFFMSYQKSIIDQFEFLHHLGKDEYTGACPSGRDPVMSYQDSAKEEINISQYWNKNWDDQSKEGVNYSLAKARNKFITLRGGEYFYAPSISFLQELDGK